MSRANKFECRLQTWVPEDVADAVQMIADQQLLDVADVVRQGVILVLRQFGAMPLQQRSNGHHKPGADAAHQL